MLNYGVIVQCSEAFAIIEQNEMIRECQSVRERMRLAAINENGKVPRDAVIGHQPRCTGQRLQATSVETGAVSVI